MFSNVINKNFTVVESIFLSKHGRCTNIRAAGILRHLRSDTGTGPLQRLEMKRPQNLSDPLLPNHSVVMIV